MKPRRTLCSVVAGIVLAAPLTGCRNQLAFSTATKFGLDISQRADQQPEVTVGYQRAEVVSIPVREQRDRTNPKRKDDAAKSATSPGARGRRPYDGDASLTNDAYAVLGTFRVTYDPAVGRSSGVHIHQVFATGLAARNAVKDTNMAKLFGLEAHKIYLNANTNKPATN